MKIKALRIQAGLTQEQCAKEIGLTKCSYAAKENYRIKLSAKELIILAKLFNVKCEDIEVH